MKKLLLVIVGLVVAIVIVVAASSSHKSSATDKVGGGTTAHPASADVSVSGSSVDEAGFNHATLTVTNHSSKPSNYIVKVSFLDSGVVVAQGSGIEDDVAPGQTAKVDVLGSQSIQRISGVVTAQVTSVERLAA